MRSALPTRIVSALVALLFFTGETGASGLDALLYHRTGAPGTAARTHYEPGGGTHHHADQCLLALRLASGRGSSSLGVAIRFESIPSRAVGVRPPAALHRSFAGLHEQSRAPPAVPA